MQNDLTVGTMLLGTAGMIWWTAALMGLCALAAAPFVAYQRYKAVRKERDDLQRRVARLTHDLAALQPDPGAPTENPQT